MLSVTHIFISCVYIKSIEYKVNPNGSYSHTYNLPYRGILLNIQDESTPIKIDFMVINTFRRLKNIIINYCLCVVLALLL